MKIKKLFITALITIITQTSFSQDFWQEISLGDTITPICIGIDKEGDVLVGTNCGVFKSFDEGFSWSHLGEMNYSIYDIVFMSNNDIYVSAGAGILKSSNGGQTWNNQSTGIGVNSLYCSIEDILFIGNMGGIYKSIDSGYYWNNVHSVASSHVFNDFTEFDNALYAGSTAYTVDTPGVFISTDSGESWQILGLIGHGISSLEVDNSGQIYAGSTGGTNGSNPGLFILDSAGLNWTHTYSLNEVKSILIDSYLGIYIGLESDVSSDYGVRFSEDMGLTWIDITAGILSSSYLTHLRQSKLDYIYAITYSPEKFYRSINPITITDEKSLVKASITIYPNPSKNKIIINVYPPPSKNGIVTITNIEGRLMTSKIFNPDSKIILDLVNYPNGLYLVNFQCQDLNVSRLVIKTK